MKTVIALVGVWLMIGSFVAGGRNETSNADPCSKTVNIALTSVLGPVNFMGAQPRLTCPESMVERQTE
jgi:hypothetical protein